MRDRKYVLFRFSPYLYKGMEEYLNEQAERGWELGSAGPLAGRLHRTWRTDLRYSVDLIPRDEGYRREYFALCRDAGWELIETLPSVAVFASLPGADPPPVQSDPAVERENFVRAMARYLIWTGLLFAAGIASILWLRGEIARTYSIAATPLYVWIYRLWLAVTADALAAMLVLEAAGLLAVWRSARTQEGAPVPPRWALWIDGIGDVLMWTAMASAWLMTAAHWCFTRGVDLRMALLTAALAGSVCLVLALAGQRSGRGLNRARRRLALAGVLAIIAAVGLYLILRQADFMGWRLWYV